MTDLVQSDVTELILRELINKNFELMLDTKTRLDEGYVCDLSSRYISMCKINQDWYDHQISPFEYPRINEDELITRIVDSQKVDCDHITYDVCWHFDKDYDFDVRFMIDYYTRLNATIITFYHEDYINISICLHDKTISKSGNRIDEYVKHDSPIIYIRITFSFDDLVKGG